MDESPNRLVVEVQGLRSDDGHVRASLYDKPDGFPDGANAGCATCIVSIENRRASLVFDAVAPGTYAVGLFHDENDDGKMNKNFLGIPTEGFGLSRIDEFKLKIPKFDDAAFEFAGGEQTLQVKMHYML